MHTSRYLRFGAVATLLSMLVALQGCKAPDSAAELVVDPMEDRLTEAATKARADQLTPRSELFGFALRKSLDLPECVPMQLEPIRTCRNSSGPIYLTASEMPDFLDKKHLLVTVDESGHLQKILGVTKSGWSSTLISLLSTSFGKPDQRSQYLSPLFKIWTWTYKDATVTYSEVGEFPTLEIVTAEQKRLDDIEIERSMQEQAKVDAKKRGI